MSGKLERFASDLKRRAERLEVPQDVEETFGAYAADPVTFAAEVLGVQQLPDYQRAFLRDVAANDRVCWVAGHATGKSHAAAILLAWYLVTRPGCRCLVTSATYERQVGRVIFAKLRTLVARATVPLPIDVTATRAQVTGHREWSAEGIPSAKPENFAGFHADRMLILADEAKAIERPTFEELQGNLASATDEARLVLLSTAGPAQGYFYERFDKRHADTWRLHRTPSTESPFAKGFAERMAEECLGEQDPVYRMRVLAEFAEDVEGQLIKLSDIHAAIGRRFEDEDQGVTLGCNIARYGDDRTVVAVRRGRAIVELVVWRGLDTIESAERIASLMNAHRAQRIFVDEIGLGAGTLDRLRQLVPQPHRVHGVNVARRAMKPETYANVRAELAWELRGQFERREISILDDPALVSELAALRYQYDAQGRLTLEAKDSAKARLGRSPDLADGLMLTSRQRGAGDDDGEWAMGFGAVNTGLSQTPPFQMDAQSEHPNVTQWKNRRWRRR